RQFFAIVDISPRAADSPGAKTNLRNSPASSAQFSILHCQLRLDTLRPPKIPYARPGYARCETESYVHDTQSCAKKRRPFGHHHLCDFSESIPVPAAH